MKLRKVLKPFTIGIRTYQVGEFIDNELVTPDIAENVSEKVYELLGG